MNKKVSFTAFPPQSSVLCLMFLDQSTEGHAAVAVVVVVGE